MKFKDQLDAENKISRKLEKNIRQYYIKDSESIEDPEKRLIAALYHQAVIDCFCQIREIRHRAREWIFSADTSPQTAEWYAEISGFEFHLQMIRKYLFNQIKKPGM